MAQFIAHLQIAAKSNYKATANLHTLQITTAHVKPSEPAFTSRFPVTHLNNGDPLASTRHYCSANIPQLN
jgi:hypothetical protein